MLTTTLLDIDGTLIDSNDAHADSWAEAMRAEGHEVRFEDVRPLIGMGADHILPKVCGIEESSSEGQRLVERRKQLFLTAYLPKLKAFPGARDLLLRMKQEGLRLCAASSSGDFLLTELLKKAGIADLIEERADKRLVKSTKPAPDIVCAALEAAGAQAREAIFLGDTPYDIEAGARAKVATVALLCGGWTRQDLMGAIEIYRDPRDLLANFSNSAFAVRDVEALATSNATPLL